MDKVKILEQQLEAKERELAELSQKMQEAGTIVETLNGRVASLSRLVENRHGVLDEANKAISVAIERNHILAESMMEALKALPEGDVAKATEVLTEALERAPEASSEGLAIVEETKKMRDAALTAVNTLNQALATIG